ncbi:MAG TPA: septum site-determining protein MinC [Thermaerobacter sp.]
MKGSPQVIRAGDEVIVSLAGDLDFPTLCTTLERMLAGDPSLRECPALVLDTGRMQLTADQVMALEGLVSRFGGARLLHVITEQVDEAGGRRSPSHPPGGAPWTMPPGWAVREEIPVSRPPGEPAAPGPRPGGHGNGGAAGPAAAPARRCRTPGAAGEGAGRGAARGGDSAGRAPREPAFPGTAREGSPIPGATPPDEPAPAAGAAGSSGGGRRGGAREAMRSTTASRATATGPAAEPGGAGDGAAGAAATAPAGPALAVPPPVTGVAAPPAGTGAPVGPGAGATAAGRAPTGDVAARAVRGAGRTRAGVVVRRTLRSGHRLVYDGDVVILGDVNPGAEVMATGDVVVFGRLRGTVHAGFKGDEQAVVAALVMEPVQLRIGRRIGRSPDGEPPAAGPGGRAGHRGTAAPRGPEIAWVRDGQVLVEPFDPARWFWQRRHEQDGAAQDGARRAAGG